MADGREWRTHVFVEAPACSAKSKKNCWPMRGLQSELVRSRRSFQRNSCQSATHSLSVLYIGSTVGWRSDRKPRSGSDRLGVHLRGEATTQTPPCFTKTVWKVRHAVIRSSGEFIKSLLRRGTRHVSSCVDRKLLQITSNLAWWWCIVVL